MPSSVRQAAVRGIKPWLSDDAWEKLLKLDPSPARRAEREARKRREAEAAKSREVPLADLSLPELARHFGTDKWGIHRYAQHYERHLGHLKHAEFSLFEIGIGGYRRANKGGASLRMWKAYFPEAKIIGLDIEDKSFVNEPRITSYQGSQTDEPLLRTIVGGAENLLVVIDDGSHRPEHVRATFQILFPLLETGGIYAIEDLQTSYWPKWGGSFDLKDPNTSVGMVKDLIDGINYEEWQRDGYLPSCTDKSIIAMHIYHNLVIIEKGDNNEGTNRNPNWDKIARPETA